MREEPLTREDGGVGEVEVALGVRGGETDQMGVAFTGREERGVDLAEVMSRGSLDGYGEDWAT